MKIPIIRAYNAPKEVELAILNAFKSLKRGKRPRIVSKPIKVIVK